MLKIVVFDCGYGGEFFADRLATEFPLVEIIRVIDWRHAQEIQTNSRLAREYAKQALRPYLGKVDLIILANHFLSITSLRHFKRKYKTQKFLGFNLTPSDIMRDTLLLTTKPVTKTVNYYNFLRHLKCKHKTLSLDSWPAKIDDGELTEQEISTTLKLFLAKTAFRPKVLILACTNFSDIKPNLTDFFGRSIKIYDGYDEVINKTYKLLNIRGGSGKKSKKMLK
ncbi:hypothetical protein IJF93_00255 [Candidatus Saccharibacteria bacterium]|nr:hypothetical protein [Candidatus Saccharibacteria bacterium]